MTDHLFADVIVDISIDALDRTFQYRIPQNLEGRVRAGTPVRIPFGKGNRVISGFVVEVTDTAKWPDDKIKELVGILEKDIPVEGHLLALAAWIRERYGGTMNEALKTVLPIRKQVKSVEEHWLTFAVGKEVAKRELDRCRLKKYTAKARLLQAMFEEGGQMTTAVAAKKYKVGKPVVDGMVKAGILTLTDKRQIGRAHV